MSTLCKSRYLCYGKRTLAVSGTFLVSRYFTCNNPIYAHYFLSHIKRNCYC